MSDKTVALLDAFESLRAEEKLDFANAIFRRLPPVDSGPLDDELVAEAGDAMANLLDVEEHDTQTR